MLRSGHLGCGWFERSRRSRLPFAQPACDMRSQMTFSITLALSAAFLALALGAGWLGARPPDPHRGPRMAPWRFIMLLAAAGLMILLVHLLNLMGLTTGRQN